MINPGLSVDVNNKEKDSLTENIHTKKRGSRAPFSLYHVKTIQ